MRFGLFSLFSQPNVAVPASQIYANAFELVRAADQAGFDCLWTAEHHFSNVGLCSAPLAIALEMSHQARQARVGVAVFVLPFHEPLRLAEEVAVVDVLTGGRLNVGLGRGYQKYEFDRYGIPIEESRTRFQEVHDLLIKAWTERGFTFQGEHFQTPPTTLFPRTIQQPHPPIWVAAASPESVDFTARHGYSLFTAAGMGPLSAVARTCQLYLDGLARYGYSRAGRNLAVGRTIFVTEDPREAEETIEHAMYQYRLSRRYSTDTIEVQDGVARPAPFADEPTPAEAREQLIWGPPEECIARIEQYRAVGIDYMNLMFSVGSLTHRQSMRSMELFVEKVLPHVAERRPAVAAAR